MIYCLPLPKFDRWTLEHQPSAMLVLGDTARDLEMPSTVLGRGSTSAEAARDLGAVKTTVTSQLKAIFGKIGTNRQGDLTRVLHSLPRLSVPIGE
jgi:hypothetical protein